MILYVDCRYHVCLGGGQNPLVLMRIDLTPVGGRACMRLIGRSIIVCGAIILIQRSGLLIILIGCSDLLPRCKPRVICLPFLR